MHDDLLLQFVVFFSSMYKKGLALKKKKNSNYQYHHKVLIMILMTKSNEQASFNYAKKLCSLATNTVHATYTSLTLNFCG
jgi:hypothetical protein